MNGILLKLRNYLLYNYVIIIFKSLYIISLNLIFYIPYKD